MSEQNRMELMKVIINWLFDNKDAYQRVDTCKEYFKSYIYDVNGNYLIGGKEVSNFITAADMAIYNLSI